MSGVKKLISTPSQLGNAHLVACFPPPPRCICATCERPCIADYDMIISLLGRAGFILDYIVIV